MASLIDLRAASRTRPATLQRTRTKVAGPATQASLHQFYEAFNEELAHFMDGDPRFLWHRAGQA